MFKDRVKDHQPFLSLPFHISVNAPQLTGNPKCIKYNSCWMMHTGKQCTLHRRYFYWYLYCRYENI